MEPQVVAQWRIGSLAPAIPPFPVALDAFVVVHEAADDIEHDA